MLVLSLFGFPAALGTGEVDGSWTTLSVPGLPGGWSGLGLGAIGRFEFFANSGAQLFTASALIATVGGLLRWRRLRPGRAVPAFGLLLAVLGQVAADLKAPIPSQVHPGQPSPGMASALLSGV